MTDREPISSLNEGGLRAPPGLGFWGTLWWWFHFLILVKLARLRFIAVLVVIGLTIVMWDRIIAVYDRWTRPATIENARGSDIEFFCPMHPTVVRDHAKEKCPICFMPLSKRKKGDAHLEALPPGIVSRVQLSPYRVTLAGIQTWRVQHVQMHKDITTVGFVEFNERELKHVAARVKARIGKIHINETGQWVSAGQELASLFSNDLIVTVQTLIDANRGRNPSLEESSRERMRLWGINDAQMDLVIAMQNVIDGHRKNDKALIELAQQQMKRIEDGEKIAAAVRKLLDGQRNNDLLSTAAARIQLTALRIHEDQIDDIMETGKAIRHLTIRSPIRGHVLKKYIKEGQYVDEGSPLYDIVDLNSVWVQAQVYEEDMVFLPTFHHPLRKDEESDKALPVSAVTRGMPNEVFKGRLSFVYPHVDQDTRTVIARFEVENPGHKLRPGTSATVKFTIPPNRVEALGKGVSRQWMRRSAVDSLRAAFSFDGFGVAPALQAAEDFALLDAGYLLAIPEGAIIDTGGQKIVYRENAPGEFEGVLVELGPRMVGPSDVQYYPVISGLDLGDQVVTAGSFLVDAETRLNPAAGSIYFGGTGGSKSGSTTMRPTTPADEDAKVKAALDKLSPGDRQLASAQKLCPIMKASRLGSMGVPVKITLEGQPVFLCCIGCEEKAKAKAQETLRKVNELKSAPMK